MGAVLSQPDRGPVGPVSDEPGVDGVPLPRGGSAATRSVPALRGFGGVSSWSTGSRNTTTTPQSNTGRHETRRLRPVTGTVTLPRVDVKRRARCFRGVYVGQRRHPLDQGPIPCPSTGCPKPVSPVLAESTHSCSTPPLRALQPARQPAKLRGFGATLSRPRSPGIDTSEDAPTHPRAHPHGHAPRGAGGASFPPAHLQRSPAWTVKAAASSPRQWAASRLCYDLISLL